MLLAEGIDLLGVQIETYNMSTSVAVSIGAFLINNEAMIWYVMYDTTSIIEYIAILWPGCTMVVTMSLDGQPPPLDGVADEDSASVCTRRCCKGFKHRLHRHVTL
jgi:hypothetical protein